MTEQHILDELLSHHVDSLHAKEAISVLNSLDLIKEGIEFRALSSGMTNRLFYLKANSGSRIVRLPGEGSEFIIDREQEAKVYGDVSPLHISDRVFYINAKTGIKVTEFIEAAHSCDPNNKEEVKLAMEHLKRFHSHRLKGYKKFDLRERIAAYEKSLKHNPSDFLSNYDAVKKSVLERLSLVEKMEKECILSHIDSVHENFIINKDKIRLIDWEYASECDPHIDIAMFCIYAYYDKNQIDSTIDLYFGNEACPQNVREKIYHYVAISGFLWAIWCEIKRDVGVLYDDYEKIQYAYGHF